jgi:hypothetical protein
MTVAAELAGKCGKLDFFLCIEGIGFPVKTEDLSAGFVGTVLAVNDQLGTLASLLGCPVGFGLELPRSVSDSYSFDTSEYKQGGMDFTIIDVAGLMLAAYRPSDPTSPNTIADELHFGVSTVEITESGFGCAAGDVVWVGGREAVLLGAENPAGTFSACTRGYLGTNHGRMDIGDPKATLGFFSWDIGTMVYKECPCWYDRRVRLYAHVPGESAVNCFLLYSGRIRDLVLSDVVAKWNFSTVSDALLVGEQSVEGEKRQGVLLAAAVGRNANAGSGGWDLSTTYGAATSGYLEVIAQQVENTGAAVGTPGLASKNDQIIIALKSYSEEWSQRERYALALQGYLYRKVPGGLAGAASASQEIPGFTPQTVVSTIGSGSQSYTRYHIEGVFKIGERLMRIYGMDTEYISVGSSRYFQVIAQRMSPDLGNSDPSLPLENDDVRFCIDNLSDDWRFNRFAINRSMPTHPIEILLMFLTSMPFEYAIVTGGVGGSTTQINTSAALHAVDNYYAGYEIHCVGESTCDTSIQNWGYSAKIVSHTGKTIVTEAWPSSGHNTLQYQVRNTKYDVLPIGWGCKVRWQDIDLDSFLAVKSQLSGARLSPFVLGQEDFDLIEFVRGAILEPYGLLIYKDRTTGKLSLRSMARPAQQDVAESAYPIAYDRNIVAWGDMKLMPTGAVSEYLIKYHSYFRAYGAYVIFNQGDPVGYASSLYGAFGGHGHLNSSIKVTDATYGNDWSNKKTIEAFLHNDDTVQGLAAIVADRLVMTRRPAPEMDLTFDLSLIPYAQAGAMLSIVSSTVAPLEPYAGTRGWSYEACRVVSSEINLDTQHPGIRCQLQVLYDQVHAGLVAPACDVTAKTNLPFDRPTVYYFTVSRNSYTSGSFWDAYDLLAGDLVSLLDATGAVKESKVFASLDYANNRIYVTTSIASTIVAGDYLTFTAYASATATANMKLSCFLAGADEEIDGDAGFEYK